MNFSSKTIVITGASSGIGKATAAVFLQHGGRVVATSERSQELAEAARELGEFGEVIPIHCDVASTREVESLAARVEDLGGADVLVNNAGIWNEREFMDIDLEMWERVLRVNLTGAFICSRAFVPQMRAKGGGAIVNTASTNGLVAEPRLAHYNASKGGLVMLTLSMSIDLAKDNIRVNAVAPGTIRTPLIAHILDSAAAGQFGGIPLGRVGQPEEIAQCIAFLASSEASYVTGHVLVCDGGQLAINGNP